MNQTAFLLLERPVSWGEAAFGFAGLVLLLLSLALLSSWRSGRRHAAEAGAAAERAREMDDKVAEMNRMQAELTGRMQTMAEILSTRQGDLARLVADRIDGLRQQVGSGLEQNVRQTTEHLGKLQERLAVIDSAQKNLTELTGEVVTLKEVLANKQARGAYGQGRMEAIIRDGLPAAFFSFQPTLSNGRRPDCLVTLPGDGRGLVIDAKFPLESFTQLRAARGEQEKKAAAARVRGDVGQHIKDIAERYFLPGETQDMALLFVPSEALHADLHEHFDDLIQKAHRARVMIVSPSLLALAIQLMQSLIRDARMREEAQVIQSEVGKLLDDVRRLGERVDKLDTHFRQAQEDVGLIKTSAGKVTGRAEKIGALEFDDGPGSQPSLPFARETRLKAAE
ncbi:DNA recombination protein RmuC [Bosea sp. (in: a-proteobacteria)]|jgi:DNA recombination protein RmuC|uniref:DNA recombination protein RmuC n=1 Tax=Bosea sp. (in: a-proteobacteria) TaxID=1871050 RepID=UPI00086E95CD|nr:DNA recombination protein RmuC [Bosea sp. (in: a-proteobacteria)]MBN9440039.1 DNA recombination protein RmuC [Bosea sp. (in: a-proteobacteria)]MBN9446723.1 DNA recombination protein RmuC [Bosea sp. (in: a-proteobacteria)]ODT55252.1 MAG: DNA recombinase [Methylobacterium sp. SCN 67-24]